MAVSAKTRRRGTLTSVTLFILLILFFEWISPQTEKSDPSVDASLGEAVRLSKVIDGDTVDVLLANGQRVRVRLLGIDAMETYHEEKLRRQSRYWKISVSAVKAFGLEAKDALLVECRKGDLILYVHAEEPLDDYGRTLGYIHAQGKDVVEPLLREGLLEVRREPHPRSKRYESLYNHAKSHEKGIFKQ